MKKIITLTLIIISSLSFASSGQWSKIAQEDNITIFAKKAESSLIPFKASGIIEANIDIVLSILKNHKDKNLWSPKLKSVKIHKTLSSQEFIFSEYYKTPWPATDREFLLKGSIKKISSDKYILSAKSINDPNLKDHFHIQTDIKVLNVTINKINENKTNLEFEFYGDMKGWMPIWLMNIIQKKWPLRFIQGLRKHSKKVRSLELRQNHP